MSPSTEPEHIAASKSKGIRIDWKDGHSSEYPIKFLRDHCPCASCTGAHGDPPRQSGEASSPFPMFQPALRMERVDPVGNYALKIRWNDGHDTGIYSWDYLRRIDPGTAPSR